MTKHEVRQALEDRYDAEALRWPLLRDKVSKQLYVRVNLPYAIRNAQRRERWAKENA